MAKTYTTQYGDTWDLISYDLFGTESRMDLLMQANYEHSDTLIFDSGIVLTVPDIPETLDTDLPFWHDLDAFEWAKEAE